MKIHIVAMLAAASLLVNGADSGPIVKVLGGQVQGTVLAKGGAIFKGIPYAQPPVGELRWREPFPVTPWKGVRAATEFGPPCAQKPLFFLPKLGEASKEDCLYLNVWTPELSVRAKLPVMVWLPGGGNYAGGSSEATYDGESLMRRGVVLVTIGYRLGTFGFFAHPELRRESAHHASGNQGFLDQILALKWVRENVGEFGGDPGNVTIFGESAGSFNVSVLMTSPLSKGLFHRAIGESGAVILAGDPLTLAQAEKRGEGFASKWKIPSGASLQELRRVSTQEILDTDPNYLASPPPNLGVTIDGYVFPREPAVVFATGQEHRVALLLGNNSRESIPGRPPSTDLPKSMEEAYGPLAARARTLYEAPAEALYGTPTAQWATDTSFRCPAVIQLLWHAAAGETAFEYEFTHVAKGRETMGSTHAAELSHVFGTLDGVLAGVGPPARGPPVDAQISDMIQQYWTNFAKTGDPNSGSLVKWPKFDDAGRAYLQFTDSGPIAKEGLRRPYCDLFIENVKRTMGR